MKYLHWCKGANKISAQHGGATRRETCLCRAATTPCATSFASAPTTSWTATSSMASLIDTAATRKGRTRCTLYVFRRRCRVLHPPSPLRSIARSFVAAADAAAPRLAFVYDRSRLRLRSLRVLSLPLLDRLPLWQSMYTGIERRYALVGLFDWRIVDAAANGEVASRWPISTSIRAASCQTARRSSSIWQRSSARINGVYSLVRAAAGPLPLVACGDTNCFAWDASQAERDLVSLLSPLERHHGAVDAHDFASIGPTHYFARANEPQLAHKIAVAFGKLGVDFPRRGMML